MKSKLTIPIVSKDEFRKILLDHLLHDKKEWTMEQVFDTLLSDGFPKLDFDDLGKCLPKMFIYLPTMAVEFGDSRFVWVVSGNNAILVNK